MDAVAFVIAAIEARRTADRPFLAAIDGQCASGKTTLATGIHKQIGCSVIPMDDFFLRPDQRTRERLLQPGGNVDWERFRKEVLLPLRHGQSAAYRPWDCHAQDWKEPVVVQPTSVFLIEGAYSCHPALWDLYDFHIFLTVDAPEQLRRIEKRNGKQGLAVFRDRWIPLEERYFQALQVAQRCELCLDMT